jgi:hypothetical protein
MQQKTTFLHYGVQQQVLEALKNLFNYQIQGLSEGFRYLGYFLKMGRYTTEDWQWMIDKFESRIRHWCNRWLSLGGRLVLIKAILESQPVYWLALSNLPAQIFKESANWYLVSSGREVKRRKAFIYAIGNLLLGPSNLGDGV